MARQEEVSVDFSLKNAKAFDILKNMLNKSDLINSLGIKTGSSIRQIDLRGTLLNAEIAKTHYGDFAVSTESVRDQSTGQIANIAIFNDKNGDEHYILV